MFTFIFIFLRHSILPSVKFEELFSLKYILLINYVKILIDILVINTLERLTIVHAERGRPAIKDDERFQNRLVRDLKISIQNSVQGKNCWQIFDRFRTDPKFKNYIFYRNKDTWFNLRFNLLVQFAVRHCLHSDIQI